MVKVTEDYKIYLEFVYDLAINKGYDHTLATNLSEMALFKMIYSGIQYPKKYEIQLRELLSGKHH